MKNKYRKMLLVLLPVIALTLILQSACTVWLSQKQEESTGADTTGGSTMFEFSNLPESTDGLKSRVKEEIAKLESDGKADNDTLTNLFMACDAEGYVHTVKDSGAAYITAKDGGQIMLSDLSATYVSRITAKALRQLLEISDTYVANAANLKYGNYYTPFNDSTTNHIDCSSFVLLSLYGIPYETSRYVQSSNTAKYDFGISLPANSYSNDFGPIRYLANEMGQYAVDHNFAFYPNEAEDNMQPGDVLFFSTNTKNENYFMNITHVAICVERQGNNMLYLVHGNSNDTCNYYTADLASPLTPLGSKNPYKDTLVLIARFPVKEDGR